MRQPQCPQPEHQHRHPAGLGPLLLGRHRCGVAPAVRRSTRSLASGRRRGRPCASPWRPAARACRSCCFGVPELRCDPMPGYPTARARGGPRRLASPEAAHRSTGDPMPRATRAAVAERPPTLVRLAAVAPRILVIDNYDSFVYNLVQYLGELGADAQRWPATTSSTSTTSSDSTPTASSSARAPARPRDAGLSNELIRTWGARVPVFGVCLGQQCIGEVFGGRVVRAPAGGARQDLADPPRRQGGLRRAAQSARGDPLPLAHRGARRRCPRSWRSPPRPRTD